MARFLLLLALFAVSILDSHAQEYTQAQAEAQLAAANLAVSDAQVAKERTDQETANYESLKTDIIVARNMHNPCSQEYIDINDALFDFADQYVNIIEGGAYPANSYESAIEDQEDGLDRMFDAEASAALEDWSPCYIYAANSLEASHWAEAKFDDLTQELDELNDDMQMYLGGL
jgi:hypothetical protein